MRVSHDTLYEKYLPMKVYIIWFGIILPACRRDLLSGNSSLTRNAGGSLDTLGGFFQMILRHSPEDSNIHSLIPLEQCT
jgi:hypothetical protein